MGTITGRRRGIRSKVAVWAAALVVLPTSAIPAGATVPSPSDASPDGGPRSYRMVDLGVAPEMDSRAVAIGPRGLIAGSTWTDAGGELSHRAALWRAPGTEPPELMGPPYSTAEALGPRGEVIGQIPVAAMAQVARWWRGEETVLSEGMPGSAYFVDVDARGRVLLRSSVYTGEFGIRITDGRRARDLTGFPDAIWRDHPRYPGYVFPNVVGLNERSQVAGTAPVGGGDGTRAFVWEEGTIRYLPSLADPEVPAASGTEAIAIDSRGVVLGTSTSADGSSVHPVLWVDGRIVDLGLLPGTWACRPSSHTEPFETGYIVGSCSGVGYDEVRAFMWHDGTMTDLGNLGRPWAGATAVNERGQVVGFSDVAGEGQHAFVWEHGVMTDLGTLGGTVSNATDIDERGRIVGYAEQANSRTHAVLWLPGRPGHQG